MCRQTITSKRAVWEYVRLIKQKTIKVIIK